MSTENERKEYQKGYRAAERKAKKEIERLQKLQNERVYMRSLDLALKHCDGWAINGKKINNAEGYCELAKIFARNAISKIEEL